VTLAVAVLVVPAASTGSTTEQTRPLRVGLVLMAGVEDRFDGMAYRGLVRAVRQLGVEGVALTAPPNESEAPTMAYLARRGYDLVIGFGALDPEGFAKVAREFPDTRFLALDMPVQELSGKPRNVQGTLFRVEEGAYLAGYLAAAMERRRPGPDGVSSVGGVKAPQVDRYIAGFEAGARRRSPGVSRLRSYANEFLDTRKCRAVAIRQIARGSGVVLPVAGMCGDGALAAARDTGRFGVGVDVDQSALGPHVLTSALKKIDVAVYRSIDALRRGRFRTGVTVSYGLAENGVGLGRLSPRVPRSAAAAVEQVRRRIIRGELSVPGRL
jgi:basic membrane protein A and related proteins